MNISDGSGESSCKRQENGDKATEVERPLKKARFAWQVKGKYHLKAESKEKKSYLDAGLNPEDVFITSSDCEIEPGDLGEQNLEILQDYLLKNDLSKLDSVQDSENSKLKQDDHSKEKIPFPSYLGIPHTCHESDSSSPSIDENSSVPMSMVYKVSSWVEDQCINRWQNLQITKACLDNSMNQILESWVMPMLATQEEGDRFHDIVDLIENLPRHNTVENEGILMAISAHGLQNNSSVTIDSESDLNSLQVMNPLSPNTSSLVFENNTSDDSGGEKSYFWDELNEACLFPDSVVRNQIEKKQSDNSSKVDSTVSSSGSPESTETTTSDQRDEDSIDIDKYYNQYGNMDMFGDSLCSDQFDFMDAAVSFAIQNKGLTSYGTDYG